MYRAHLRPISSTYSTCRSDTLASWRGEYLHVKKTHSDEGSDLRNSNIRIGYTLPRLDMTPARPKRILKNPRR